MWLFTSRNIAKNSSSRPSGTSKQLMNRTISSPLRRSLHIYAITARSYTYVVATRQARNANEKPASDTGRVAQRRRTRTAIVEATRALVAAGDRPSIDDIAAAADVSRRTIYMYFPTVDQLLLDATAGLLSDATVNA